MLGGVGVGAGDEHAPLRELGEGRPDLLPGDDPFVAVLDRAGLQRGEVGARLRLGEALAPDLLGGEDRLQVALLLLVGAVGDDDRAAHRQAEHVGRARRFRRAASPTKIACSIIVAPRPPYSFGQEMPAQPASCSLCCHSRRKAITSSRPASGSGPGWFSSSQARTSSRNSCSDGERRQVHRSRSIYGRWRRSQRPFDGSRADFEPYAGIRLRNSVAARQPWTRFRAASRVRRAR